MTPWIPSTVAQLNEQLRRQLADGTYALGTDALGVPDSVRPIYNSLSPQGRADVLKAMDGYDRERWSRAIAGAPPAAVPVPTGGGTAAIPAPVPMPTAAETAGRQSANEASQRLQANAPEQVSEAVQATAADGSEWLQSSGEGYKRMSDGLDKAGSVNPAGIAAAGAAGGAGGWMASLAPVVMMGALNLLLGGARQEKDAPAAPPLELRPGETFLPPEPPRFETAEELQRRWQGRMA